MSAPAVVGTVFVVLPLVTPGDAVWFSVKAQEVALRAAAPAPRSSDPVR